MSLDGAETKDKYTMASQQSAPSISLRELFSPDISNSGGQHAPINYHFLVSEILHTRSAQYAELIAYLVAIVFL